MKHFSRWSAFNKIALASLMLALTACGGGSGNPEPDPPYTPPTPPPSVVRQVNVPTSAEVGLGQIFVADDGLSLYVFENDRNDTDGDGAGDSDCNGTCAETWPPLFADSSSVESGQFTIINRDDGEIQWAFKGLPLYKFNTDSAQGDTNGEGVNNIWFVARPDPVKTAEVDSTAKGTIFVGDFSVLGTDGGGGQSTTRVNRTGFSLYTFENDRNDADGDGFGDSDCNAGCAEIWPPLYADQGSTAMGNFSIITRDDGTSQWAYLGLPLYFFANDAVAGDTNGEGVNDIWYVARPEPTGAQLAAPTSAESSLGQIFVTTDGLTLYTFENDRNDTENDGAGDSDCNGDCAGIWPPLFASNLSQPEGQFSIIRRDNGEAQWAFKGLPLYRFNTDANAGDTNGEGINDIWYVARPDPFKTAEVDATAKGAILVGDFSVTGTDGSGAQADTRIDRTGFSLYTFENDRNDANGDGFGDSDCNGGCAEIWPPLFADKGATATGMYSIITRDDGSSQWAYKGLPLYFFASDTAAGDTNGEGVNAIWYVARPNPTKIVETSLGAVIASATSIASTDGNGGIDVATRAREGFSLYVFDNDKNDADADGLGDSDCNAGCAEIWPPLFADDGAIATGNYSIISRDDGTQQWAYNDEPLYFFMSDSAEGDINGDQVNNIWHLARTAPLQVTTDSQLGDIFAARGQISDVDSNGARAETSTDRTGFIVYLFDDDTNDTDGDGFGDSDCNGSCAVTWPPLYANEGDMPSGEFTIITRDDGSLQWAYKGQPLYFFAPDANPGDTGGVYGTWHEVNP